MDLNLTWPIVKGPKVNYFHFLKQEGFTKEWLGLHALDVQQWPNLSIKRWCCKMSNVSTSNREVLPASLYNILGNLDEHNASLPQPSLSLIRLREKPTFG
jgi:hypothetical protein